MMSPSPTTIIIIVTVRLDVWINTHFIPGKYYVIDVNTV